MAIETRGKGVWLYEAKAQRPSLAEHDNATIENTGETGSELGGCWSQAKRFARAPSALFLLPLSAYKLIEA